MTVVGMSTDIEAMLYSEKVDYSLSEPACCIEQCFVYEEGCSTIFVECMSQTKKRPLFCATIADQENLDNV
jgi:hypothetical protein